MQELATRELERRYAPQRGDLLEFIQLYFQEERPLGISKFALSPFHYVIADRLHQCFEGKITRLIINIPPGHGKCLHKDTIVNTPIGIKPISELCVGDDIYSYKDKQLIIEQVLAIEPANKKSLSIRTKTGRVIVMSTDHRMLGINGYKEAKNFIIGEHLYCLNKEIDSVSSINDDELVFITNMLFEGCCGGKTLRYSNTDEGVINDFIQASNNLGIQIKKYECNSDCDYNIMGGMKGEGANLLDKYGLLGHKCYTKRIPQTFFTMSLQQKYRFIGIMIATDGYYMQKSGNIGISLANEKLIDDIQYLISTCGIVSSKTTKTNNAWCLTIGRSQAQKLLGKCNFYHKEKYIKKICDKEGISYSEIYPNSITKGLNGYKSRKLGCRIDNNKDISLDRFERLCNIFPEVEEHRYRDFFRDEIVDIQEVGEQDLIHIQVSGDQNFIANCFVSHNTELITKSFPVWALGNNPHTQIIATGYSTTLTQGFSSEANQYYASDTFRKVFPRNGGISDKQNTKEYWKTVEGGGYYATGTGGTITGKRANIFLIDDPIKPDEADKSAVIRDGVNSRFSNTVPSRLFNPESDCIIIVQQRTHDDDLSGFLINKMNEGREKREVLSMPAIAERDETYETRYGIIERKQGEPLDGYRFPISAINKLKEGMNPQAFSSQYMQNPVNKEAQEFHEEWFLYHKGEQEEGQGIVTPKGLRIFTTVDPAFKQNQYNDDTCIMTGGFMDDKLYILEYTAGKFTADVMQEKIIYHIQKWSPEKVGIEAFQAQSMINVFLKQELQKRRIYAKIEEVKQTGDKESKIRKLLALYKNGLIYHKIGMDSLENQLVRFPKGAHDDIIDALQMLYDLYTIAPQNDMTRYNVKIDYDQNGIPIYS